MDAGGKEGEKKTKYPHRLKCAGPPGSQLKHLLAKRNYGHDILQIMKGEKEQRSQAARKDTR